MENRPDTTQWTEEDWDNYYKGQTVKNLNRLAINQNVLTDPNMPSPLLGAFMTTPAELRKADFIQQTYDKNMVEIDRAIYEVQEALKATEDPKERESLEVDLVDFCVIKQKWVDFYQSQVGKEPVPIIRKGQGRLPID